MAQNPKQIRAKTQREVEIEKLPNCPYDPAHIDACTNYEFPPSPSFCENCLSRVIMRALDDGALSEATRWFIAYKNLRGDMQNGP